VITPGTYGPAAISPASDHDFFRFNVDAARDVMIQIAFLNIDGDLDLRLRDSAGTVIASSESSDDNEEITCPGAGGSPSCNMSMPFGPGDFFIEVYGFNSMFANDSYTLTLTVP
jgi:hypothetical protein